MTTHSPCKYNYFNLKISIYHLYIHMYIVHPCYTSAIWTKIYVGDERKGVAIFPGEIYI